MGKEVDLKPFIQWCLKNSKTVYVPCILEESYLLRQLLSLDQVEANRDGVYEPKIGEFLSDYTSVDLSIVPGVAFDLEHNRMGRGSGHYDRLLAQIPSYKIGICYDFQRVNSLDPKPWDIPMDEVIVVPS